MDRRRHLAAGTRHAAVGDESNLMAPILQYAEHRCQLVQLRHAIGTWALEADNHDDVSVELAGLECRQRLILVGEDPAWRLDRPAPLIDRAGLEDRTPEVATDQPHAPVRPERVTGRAKHVGVAGL